MKSIDISNDRIIIYLTAPRGTEEKEIFKKKEIEEIIIYKIEYSSKPIKYISLKIQNNEKENTFVEIEGLDIEVCKVVGKVIELNLHQ